MIFNREALLRVLNVCKLAVDKRDFIPILSHFCFLGKTVTAYNDLIGIRVSLKTNFVCALQAETLLKLANSVSVKEIELGFTDKTIYFKSGQLRKGVRARLPYMKEEDFFFKWPSMSRLASYSIDAKQAKLFLRGIDLCLSSVGDQTPTQMGITLTESKSNLVMYSTNNFAISRFAMRKWGEGFDNMILPTSFCKAMLKASEVFGMDQIKISRGKQFVIVSFGDECRMYAKLIGNKDPLDFGKVVRQHVPKTHKEDRQKLNPNFLEGFQRSLIILSGELAKTVKILFDKTLVTIEAKSHAGKLKSSAEFKKRIVRNTFCVNAELAIKGCENASHVYFGENCLVFSKGNYTYLLGTQPAD